MIGIIAPEQAFEEYVEARDDHVTSLCFHPAGQGVNMARAVRELGEACTLVGFNGGESGLVLRALLDAYQIDHRLVQMQGETAVALMLTHGHAEQHALLLAPPAVSRHEADDLYSAASLLIMECPVVILTTDLLEGMPPDFFVRLTRLANRYRVRTLVDLPLPLLTEVVAAEPMLVKPSLDQVRQSRGLDAEASTPELLEVADGLRQGGAGAVVLSQGKDGAIMVTGEGAWRLVPPAVEAVVERGAGDCMTGAMAVGLCRGEPLLEAARLGAAAGCAKVMRHGLGTCKRVVTERLLSRIEVQRLR